MQLYFSRILVSILIPQPIFMHEFFFFLSFLILSRARSRFIGNRCVDFSSRSAICDPSYFPILLFVKKFGGCLFFLLTSLNLFFRICVTIHIGL